MKRRQGNGKWVVFESCPPGYFRTLASEGVVASDLNLGQIHNVEDRHDEAPRRLMVLLISRGVAAPITRGPAHTNIQTCERTKGNATQFNNASTGVLHPSLSENATPAFGITRVG